MRDGKPTDEEVQRGADVLHELGCIAQMAGLPCGPDFCNRHDGDGEHLMAHALLSNLGQILDD